MIKTKLLQDFKNEIESAMAMVDRANNTPLHQLYEISSTIQYYYDHLEEEFDNLQKAGIDTTSVEDQYYEVRTNLSIILNSCSTTC